MGRRVLLPNLGQLATLTIFGWDSIKILLSKFKTMPKNVSMRFKTEKKQFAFSRIRTYTTFSEVTARNIIDLVAPIKQRLRPTSLCDFGLNYISRIIASKPPLSGLAQKGSTDRGSNVWRKSIDQKRNAPKMAILTKKSKIFIKAKVIFMKSCLLGYVGFMIRYILNKFNFFK